jgi:signal transduction histidine kinase
MDRTLESPLDQPIERSGKLAVEVVALAAIYVALARAGLSLDAVAGYATLVWLPTAVALFALLWRGARLWPGIALGAFIVNAMQGAPAHVAATIAAGNTAEAVLAFTLLTRVVRLRFDFSRTNDVIGFVVVAGLLSPMVSATVGTATLWTAALVSTSSVPLVWYAWWAGDATGAMVLVPCLLTWLANPVPRPRVEDFAAWGVALLAAVVAFGGFSTAGGLSRFYLVFPPLIWTSLRCGPRSTATAVLLVSCAATIAATLGQGHFAGTRLMDRLLALHTLLMVVATTTLMLSAAIAERRARDQLICVASHELRNLLGSLTLYHELLGRTVRAGASQKQLECVTAKAERPLRRLTQLVGELLDVSRAREGALELRREVFDLAELVEEVVARLGGEAAQQGSLVELYLEPTFGRWDRSRIDQVVSNVLGNAAKYGGGKPVAILVSSCDGTARLVLEDHGAGIAPKDQERIFEPFVRLSDARTSGGTGLGLAISREIVNAHGGRIWVESALGLGSRFVIELPTGRGQLAGPDDPFAPQHPSGYACSR